VEENKFLKAARTAREDNNATDAKRYYEMVKMDDPNHAEAKFFYSYYTITSGIKGDAYNGYITFFEMLPSAVKAVARSEDMTNTEKTALLKDMANTVKEMPMLMYQVLNSISQTSHGKEQLAKTNQRSIRMLYSFGDEIEKNFSNDEEIISTISVDLWKSGISLQRKWVGVAFDKTYPEKYASKIQKYDSSYTPPQGNALRGCIGSILGAFSH